MTQPLFSVWEGVFKSFEEAGGDLDAFESNQWIEKQKIKILNKHADLENANLGISKDYPLPLVVSMLLSQQNEISILDFGGGMGAQYLEILAQVPYSREKMKYCIVDGEATIKNVPSQLKKYSNLMFVTSLEALEEPADIVHIGSALQYIEKWEGLLSNLIQKYQPKYLVFSDLLAGDVPTFVSHQIFYGKKIPHKILSWVDFESYLTDTLGFCLKFKSKFIRSILNQEEVFPNFGLPPTHRIERALNAIFYRL
ncbi:MAG: methyltransferase, TIGR04325 family [Candidatus Paracaedibacter sp.]